MGERGGKNERAEEKMGLSKGGKVRKSKLCDSELMKVVIIIINLF